MYKMSFSRMDLFHSCKFAFFKKYVEKLEPPPSVVSERGKATHAALEEAVKTIVGLGRALKAAEIRAIVERACDKHLTLKELHPKGAVNDILAMVRFGISSFDPAMFDSVATELKVEFPIDAEGNIVNGIIDLRLVDTAHQVHIIDYKTGAVKAAAGSDQLVTYAVNDVMALGKPVEVYYYFLGEKECVSATVTMADVERVLDKYRETLRQIEARTKAGINAFDPTPGKQCEYCAYSGCCPVTKFDLGVIPAVLSLAKYTEEDLVQLGQWVLAAESTMDKAKALLKQAAARDGYIEVGDQYFAQFQKFSTDFAPGDVVKFLQSKGVSDEDIYKCLSVSKTSLKKYQRNEEWGLDLEAMGKSKVSNEFTHKSEKPYIPDTSDEDVASILVDGAVSVEADPGSAA